VNVLLLFALGWRPASDSSRRCTENKIWAQWCKIYNKYAFS